MPVVLLIVFGIIEFGLAFKDSLSVSSSTRAGARTASAEELWVYRAMPDGSGLTATAKMD